MHSYSSAKYVFSDHLINLTFQFSHAKMHHVGNQHLQHTSKRTITDKVTRQTSYHLASKLLPESDLVES